MTKKKQDTATQSARRHPEPQELPRLSGENAKGVNTLNNI